MLVGSVKYKVLRVNDFILGSVKFTLFFALILLFLMHQSLSLLLIRNRKKLLRYHLKVIALTSKVALRILNVSPDYINLTKSNQPILYVCNHLSYLDVLVLFSEYPSLFITSKEMGEVFLLGHITKLSGCFHIERRKKLISKEILQQEFENMKSRISQGFNLFLFPEGTSSDGESVLKFKSHFFQLAIDNGLTIQPLCLKYELNEENRDSICWYGEMGFADHLFRLCCLRRISVKVHQLGSITTEKGADRIIIAQDCHEKIRKVYGED